MAQSQILNICPSIVVFTMKIYMWTIVTNKLTFGHGARPILLVTEHCSALVHQAETVLAFAVGRIFG